MSSLFEHCRGEKTWCEKQRFLCIDNTVYHIGASLKDLGRKWLGYTPRFLRSA